MNPRMTRRQADGTLLIAVFGFSVLGRLSMSAQTADIDLTPTQATVYVNQCTQFFVTISPSQPNTVDISIEYSDPSRLGYVETGFPIYPPGTSQYFSVCGRVAGMEPITITVALPTVLGGGKASTTAAVINPVPQPRAIWPTSITAGSGAFDLQIWQAFPTTLIPESQVVWNGVPKPTSFHYYEGVCPGICPLPYLLGSNLSGRCFGSRICSDHGSKPAAGWRRIRAADSHHSPGPPEPIGASDVAPCGRTPRTSSRSSRDSRYSQRKRDIASREGLA